MKIGVQGTGCATQGFPNLKISVTTHLLNTLLDAKQRFLLVDTGFCGADPIDEQPTSRDGTQFDHESLSRFAKFELPSLNERLGDVPLIVAYQLSRLAGSRPVTIHRYAFAAIIKAWMSSPRLPPARTIEPLLRKVLNEAEGESKLHIGLATISKLDMEIVTEPPPGQVSAFTDYLIMP